MKRLIGLVSVVLLSAALAGCSVGPAAENQESSAKTSGTSISTYKMLQVSSEEELSRLDSRDVAKDFVIVKTVSGFDPSVFTDTLGAAVEGSFDLNGAVYWHLQKAGGTVKLISDLEKTKGVYYAEHELKLRIPEERSGTVSKSVKTVAAQPKDAAAIKAVFNDPLTWGSFGHFSLTKALNAYSTYGFGSTSIYVVDVDTGLNKIHEDFYDASGNSIVVRAKSAFDSSDDYVGDSGDFVDSGDNWDANGHGTHTAGTIAACGNNGKGVAGVCWKNAKLISYKCFSATSKKSGCDWAVFGGLKDLVKFKNDNGITQTIPVNMSLGGSLCSQFEIEMVNYGLQNNVVICAAMGNDGQHTASYPAAFAGVIGVGATDPAGNRIGFSNMGRHCSIMAPGSEILSTYNGGTSDYHDDAGTSMATPFITGTVAYLLTFNPTMKPDQIKTLLEETATDIGDTGFDEETGWGLVNVYAAAKKINDGDIPASGSVYSNGALKISVTNTNASYSSGLASYPSALCNQDVYLYNSDGEFVYVCPTDSVSGIAEFRLLPPGTYTASTAYKGTTKSVSVTVGGTGDASGSIAFDISVS